MTKKNIEKNVIKGIAIIMAALTLAFVVPGAPTDNIVKAGSQKNVEQTTTVQVNHETQGADMF